MKGNKVSTFSFVVRAVQLAWQAFEERRLPLSPRRWLIDLRHLHGAMGPEQPSARQGRPTSAADAADKREASFLSPLLRDPSSTFHLVNQRTGSVIANHLVGAFDSKTRRTGLLAHQSMPAGTAMIIAPSNAIHTFFMKFAIDLLFVSKHGVVVKTRVAVPPWRVSGAWSAHAVIELAAGTLRQTPVDTGDRVIVVTNHA